MIIYLGETTMKLYLNQDNTKGFIFHHHLIKPTEEMLYYSKTYHQHFQEMLNQNGFLVKDSNDDAIIFDGIVYYYVPLEHNLSAQITFITDYYPYTDMK